MSPGPSRRRDAPATARPEPPATSGDDRLLTSKDLFADMVDSVEEGEVPRPGPARTDPIRVQVKEPGRAPTVRSATDAEESLLPSEVAALLDTAFAPAEGPPSPEPSVERDSALPTDLPPPARNDIDEHLDALQEMLESGHPAPPGGPPEQERRVARPGSPEQALEADRRAARFKARPARRAGRAADDVNLAEVVEHAFRSAETGGRRGRRLPPRNFGPYVLGTRVAAGGMAEVYRAKRTGVEGFEKVVAVKRILPHLSENKEFLEMFIDEAKMVAGLTHPNIVQIYDLGRIEQSYFIAMEYVHGRDLRSILKRARERGMRLPLDLSVLIVSRVCAALDYAHKKRDEEGRQVLIVHRDVSPQNILISFEGEVKLTDFGIAKAATKARSTDSGTLRGKLLYMSPEQAWGKPMDRRADIFSLGLVFYEMTTDQRPFLAGSEANVLELVRECRIAPPTALNPRITPGIERVVMKALDRDPENRYQDAGEMLKDLDRVLHERQPPTAAELARFMEILFDEEERGAPRPVTDDGVESLVSKLEIEFEGAHGVVGKDEPADARRTQGNDASVKKLMKRLGLK